MLGSVDLDEFVDEALTEVQDWELNFKVRGDWGVQPLEPGPEPTYV